MSQDAKLGGVELVNNNYFAAFNNIILNQND